MNPFVALSPQIERVLVAVPRALPQAEHLESFVATARDVLEQELGTAVQPGEVRLADGTCTTQDVTAIIGITGQVTGVAVCGMSTATALAIVGRLMDEPVEELDELVLSGIGELCNVIAGRATAMLADSGFHADISPPVLLVGAGTRVSTAGIPRLVVPLVTDLGTVETELAIRGTF